MKGTRELDRYAKNNNNNNIHGAENTGVTRVLPLTQRLPSAPRPPGAGTSSFHQQ